MQIAIKALDNINNMNHERTIIGIRKDVSWLYDIKSDRSLTKK